MTLGYPTGYSLPDPWSVARPKIVDEENTNTFADIRMHKCFYYFLKLNLKLKPYWVQMIISWCIQLVSVLCHVARGARSLHTGVTGLLSGDGMAVPSVCPFGTQSLVSTTPAASPTICLWLYGCCVVGTHPHTWHAKGMNEQWDTLALTGVLITVENEEFTDAWVKLPLQRSSTEILPKLEAILLNTMQPFAWLPNVTINRCVQCLGKLQDWETDAQLSSGIYV